MKLRVVKTYKKFGEDRRIGIHLLNPTPHEIELWKEAARAKGFDVIYVHTTSVHNIQTHKVQV